MSLLRKLDRMNRNCPIRRIHCDNICEILWCISTPALEPFPLAAFDFCTLHIKATLGFKSPLRLPTEPYSLGH